MITHNAIDLSTSAPNFLSMSRRTLHNQRAGLEHRCRRALFLLCHSERSEETRIFLGARHFDFTQGTRSRPAPNSRSMSRRTLRNRDRLPSSSASHAPRGGEVFCFEKDPGFFASRRMTKDECTDHTSEFVPLPIWEGVRG